MKRMTYPEIPCADSQWQQPRTFLGLTEILWIIGRLADQQISVWQQRVNTDSAHAAPSPRAILTRKPIRRKP